MEDMPLAHSPNSEGVAQHLLDHLRGVGELSALFASKFDAGPLGRVVGFLHDIGKISPRFQRYLRGLSISGGDHTTAGSIVAARMKLPPAASFVIAGHHGGIPELGDVKQRLRATLEPECETALQQLIAELSTELPGLSAAEYEPETQSDFELSVRMLFSALVDADFLDTEAHFCPVRNASRGGRPGMRELLDRFTHEYESRFAGATTDKGISVIRKKVYDWCVRAASEPQGVFTLTVPTGGGKTLSGLAFALTHAAMWNLDRVIVVIPYTSIVEQTCDIYRMFLGDEAVIEHHSAYDPRGDEEDERQMLAAENWDAPVIVTTSVQFFESLFSNKPARCRKLHNICRSVVVIDEVQTVPLGLLKPVFDVIESLVKRYCVTFLFTTATQPAYSELTSLPMREIVPDPIQLAMDLRRVSWKIAEKRVNWDQVAHMACSHPQSMVIVNTRKDARALHALVKQENTFHLSSNMCPAHRRSVLYKVRDLLAQGKECRVIATQVVETGVDVDFPLVMRAMGPLERIVQAAGRCNREWRHNRGTVTLFRPQDGGLPPGSYTTATQRTDVFLQQQGLSRLEDPRVHEEYFRSLYACVDLDARGITELRNALDFPNVAQRFRFIEEECVPVVVPWEDGISIAQSLAAKGFLTRADWRKVQPYVVNMSKYAVQTALKRGLCAPLFKQAELYIWGGTYDEHIGLTDEFDTLVF
ncbi:MAG: CRISPR-associated endonuclease Cas3'' [Thermoleophilia bacterium]|nr:CRISPR-associated endonuclease Cas3'' [Thermoleophilia bacterium]